MTMTANHALQHLLELHDDAVFVCGSDDELKVENALHDARAALRKPDHSPILLNMLQRMVDECGEQRVTADGVLASAPCLLTLEHARQAIAKAKGEA